MARKVKGAILIGILITTVVGMFMGIADTPASIRDIVGTPASLSPIFFQLDFVAAIKELGFMLIFAFTFVDLFDTMGTLMGTGARAGFLDEKGHLPRIKMQCLPMLLLLC